MFVKVDMPKSKVRKKNDFTATQVSRTPVKVKAGPSSVWFVVFFLGLMVVGLAWLLVFQLALSLSYSPYSFFFSRTRARGTTRSRLLS